MTLAKHQTPGAGNDLANSVLIGSLAHDNSITVMDVQPFFCQLWCTVMVHFVCLSCVRSHDWPIDLQTTSQLLTLCGIFILNLNTLKQRWCHTVTDKQPISWPLTSISSYISVPNFNFQWLFYGRHGSDERIQ